MTTQAEQYRAQARRCREIADQVVSPLDRESWLKLAAEWLAMAATGERFGTGATLNMTDDPDYWRKRAEEARAIAVQMMDAHTKAVMLSIAQDYEKLASRTEQRAGKAL